MKLCRVEGCPKQAHSKDMCPKHFGRWKRNGDPLRKVRGIEGQTCRANGCDRTDIVHVKESLCAKHWHRWKRYGDPNITAWRTGCDVFECDERHFGRGYCNAHYHAIIGRPDRSPLELRQTYFPSAPLFRAMKLAGLVTSHYLSGKALTDAEWNFNLVDRIAIALGSHPILFVGLDAWCAPYTESTEEQAA